MPSSLNGTGVTFNDGSTLQSGNIPAANMGSGTANSSTFLRGDRTWQSIPAPVIPTDFGAVGTYAILMMAANNNLAINGTIAGSSLRHSPSVNQSGSLGQGGSVQLYLAARRRPDNANYDGGGTALSGTWRKMDNSLVYLTRSEGYQQAYYWLCALYVRIS